MTDRREARRYAPGRFTAFVDAVVAIAMTLLILPLVEAVSESGKAGIGTLEFFQENSGQLWSFALSFLLIATFWMEHHRQYEAVTEVTPQLIWLNVLWLVTIVWLPVPTAMLGQMEDDPAQAAVYIGTLMLTQLTTLWTKAYLLRNSELTTTPAETLRHAAVGDVAAIVLFGIALAVAVWASPLGYLGLVLVAFTHPLERMLYRLAFRTPAQEPPAPAQ